MGDWDGCEVCGSHPQQGCDSRIHAAVIAAGGQQKDKRTTELQLAVDLGEVWIGRLRDETVGLKAEVERLRDALASIEAWDLCAKFRREYGSNGERDHFRSIARNALSCAVLDAKAGE